MKTFAPLIAGIFLLITACTNDPSVSVENNPRTPDYLIFGHFYGECGGKNCIRIFKLDQSQLFEDTKDTYPNATDFYKGDYSQLSQQQYAITKDLADYFPDDLLKETTTVIGQPDAGDWGGLYIEYNDKGIRKFWLLDQAQTECPGEVP